MMHDVYRYGTTQNLAYAVAGGASAPSNAFGSQTRYIRVVAVGVVGATNDGVRIAIEAAPVASATTILLALNIPEFIKVSPGQKIAALSNNATVGSLNVTELTD